MLYKSYLSYLKECDNFSERHQVYLTQQDFDENPVCVLSGVLGGGSLRLVMSNDYYLSENITLDFNSNYYYFPTKEQQELPVSSELQLRGFKQKYLYPTRQNNGSYDLGFFGGIVVEASDITIDGNGFQISMSEQFALNQRFFSIINLGSAPFIPRTGPGDFGILFTSPKHTIIKNIILGRSSHNGILGNDIHHLYLTNVDAIDWEVSGMTLNNSDYVTVKDSNFKDSNKKVFVRGSYAQFFFTFQKMREQVAKDSDKFLLETYEVFKGIYGEINSQFQEGKITNEEFRNPSMLTDGLQYGISISQRGPSIGGFGICDTKPSFDVSENVTLKNVCIKNLKAKPEMIKGFYGDKPLVLAIGRLVPQNYTLLPSVMALLKLYRYAYENQKNYFFSPTNLTRIDVENLLDGNLSGYKNYVNADVMNHLSKPMMGIRAQYVKKMCLCNVSIRQIINVGKCFKLDGVKHPESHYLTYQGAGVIGLGNIKSEIKRKKLNINNLISCNGKMEKVFNLR